MKIRCIRLCLMLLFMFCTILLTARTIEKDSEKAVETEVITYHNSKTAGGYARKRVKVMPKVKQRQAPQKEYKRKEVKEYNTMTPKAIPVIRKKRNTINYLATTNLDNKEDILNITDDQTVAMDKTERIETTKTLPLSLFHQNGKNN